MDNQLDSLVYVDRSAKTIKTAKSLPIDICGSFSQTSPPAVDPVSTAFRPLSSYSSPELLAASDALFGLLDDPAGHCGNELLAQYEAICEELSRREPFEAARNQAAAS